MWWIVLLYVLQICLLMALALRSVTRPATALAWLVIGLCLPILGPAIYFVLSRPFEVRRSRHVQRAKSDAMHLPAELQESSRRIADVVRAMTDTVPVNASLRVFHDGVSTFDALFASLRSATSTIDIEFFIVREDHVGQQLIQTLCQKAASGVRVRFLRDGIGSIRFPRKALRTLREHGIECRTFFPLQFPWLTPRLNHRDHCKIAVIDGKEAFVGGINIGDEYTGRKPTVGPWRDTHMQIRGDEAVRQLQVVFNMNWGVATPDFDATRVHRTRRTRRSRLRRKPDPMLSLAGEWAGELAPVLRDPASPPDGWIEGRTQTVESGPDSPIETIRHLFISCLVQAKQSVDITTPYFVPDTDVLTALKIAAFSGVHVRLLIPRQPDHKIVGMASRTFFQDLLAAGIDVFLYDGAVLHAKVMTVDGELSVVGAANYDMRSFRLSYEVCQVIYSKEFAAELTAQFERDLRQASQLTRDWLKGRSGWDIFQERAARLLAPLL